MVASGSGSNSDVNSVSSTPTYSDQCPNLSPEMVAVLTAVVQGLKEFGCENIAALASQTNTQLSDLQEQINLLSGAVDLSELQSAVNAIMGMIDPDGNGSIQELFAPLQAQIDSANEAAATAAQSAATAQQTATTAQQTATTANQAAVDAAQSAATAQQTATNVASDLGALSDLLDETVSDINASFAALQAAHCAEKLAIKNALDQFVNVTLTEILSAPCELPAPVIGQGGNSGGNSGGGNDPSTVS